MGGSDLMRTLGKRQACSMVRCWIRGSGHERDRIGYPAFQRKCVELGVLPEDCEALLRRLERSGTVMYTDGVVHINPNDLFSKVQGVIGIKEELPVEKRIRLLEEKLKALDAEKSEVDQRMEANRRKTWARVAAYCGGQMWLFARFTFVDFEWDIMEPISWLVVQGNAVIFFAFLWRYGVEHSFERFDEVRVSQVLVKTYDAYGFDFESWVNTRNELKALSYQRAEGLQGL